MKFRPKASATLLGFGVVVLVIGQVIYSAGQQQAIEAVLNPYRDAGNGQTIGALVSLVGLVMLVNGLLNLARSIDYLAAREHARSAIAETSPAQPGLSAEARDAAERGQAIVDGGA